MCTQLPLNIEIETSKMKEKTHDSLQQLLKILKANGIVVSEKTDKQNLKIRINLKSAIRTLEEYEKLKKEAKNFAEERKRWKNLWTNFEQKLVH